MNFSFKHFGEAGKAKIKADPCFDFYSFEILPDNNRILMKGCLTAVKENGETEWIGGDEMSIMITKYEVISWCKRYEKETGKCSLCFGEGKLMKSWDYKTGTKYKECYRCSGSGLADLQKFY